MNTSIVCVVLFSMVLCFGLSDGLKMPPIIGEVAPLIPTDAEKMLCAENAKGRKVDRVYKIPKRTCEVMCTYDDGSTEELLSPKDTLCCDMVGVGPTGKCDGNGKCKIFMLGMDE